MNSRHGGDIFSLFFGGERKEIDEEVRRKVDEKVRRMVSEGIAELIPGVLFIDESSMLDIETYAFLNRAMEQDLSPIIIFATNRGITRVRGTDLKSPHGMPLDLLDRLLVITTRKYSGDEIREIIRIRAAKERMEVDDEALELLVKIGEERSLRYALQLLAPAWEMAKADRYVVKREHVERAYNLFSDVKRSVEYLQRMEKEMLYD
jgi:TBP-interacting protein